MRFQDLYVYQFWEVEDEILKSQILIEILEKIESKKMILHVLILDVKVVLNYPLQKHIISFLRVQCVNP